MLHLTRRKMFSASAINGGGFMLASLATVLWYFLIVKYYPGEASGQMLLSLSVAGLINLLDLGVSLGLVSVLSAGNEISGRHSRWDYVSSALVVTTLNELLVGSLAVGWWKSTSFPSLPDIGYFSIVIFAVSTQAILLSNSAFKGLCDFKAANLIMTGSTVAVYGVGVGAVLIGKNVWIVFLAMACIQLLAACCAVVYANKRLRAQAAGEIISASESIFVVYADLLRISVKFYPQMFTGIFFMHAQRFIIARYSGLNAVAVISFAYSIATRIHSVVNAFLEVIFPMARQLMVQGVNPNVFCVRVGTLSAAAYFAVALIVSGVASLLVPGIFLPLITYSIGVMFAVAVAPAFHLLNGSGESFQVSICSLLSPLIFLGLAPILHSYLTVGSEILLPIAYSLTMAVMLLQVALLVRRHSRRIILASLHQSTT